MYILGPGPLLGGMATVSLMTSLHWTRATTGRPGVSAATPPRPKLPALEEIVGLAGLRGVKVEVTLNPNFTLTRALTGFRERQS